MADPDLSAPHPLLCPCDYIIKRSVHLHVIQQVFRMQFYFGITGPLTEPHLDMTIKLPISWYLRCALFSTLLTSLIQIISKRLLSPTAPCLLSAFPAL